MAVAPQSTKANLRTTFKGSSLWTDKQAVQTAKNNLAQQILAKNTSLAQYESALSNAQLKVIQDEDTIATGVCGQLSSTQLAAASTLYTNLQNNRQTVRGISRLRIRRRATPPTMRPASRLLERPNSERHLTIAAAQADHRRCNS